MTAPALPRGHGLRQAFRHADGLWPNTLALGFTVLAWPLGIAALTATAWWLNAIGLLLVTLSLSWSAYFIHEFAHQAIFKKPQTNARWAEVMAWLNGACYARFDDMRRKHMRHHVERADVITFDVRGWLLQSPAWLRGTVLALEWAYVPAVEFIMRGFVLVLPFKDTARHGQRGRILSILVLRTAAWAALASVSPKAVALYLLAYIVFITLLRFADCFQHTYDAYPIVGHTPIPNDKLRDKAYEQDNTFSDVVGLHSPWLNLIWLNFGFHNAHHERPTAPWYRLPALHHELFDDDDPQVITVRELLRSFHRNRVRRVLAQDYGVVHPPGTPGRADGFVGAVGVSFLTAV
jgi:fatty acid desaturase